MNRFKIAIGRESDFEDIWENRETHLDDVKGFQKFNLLKGSTSEEYTLYTSHSTWDSKSDFENWKKSEAFRNLLQSEELNTEVELLKKELMDMIVNSDDDEKEVREAAYMRIKVINELMARFESIAKDDEIKDRAWKII